MSHKQHNRFVSQPPLYGPVVPPATLPDEDELLLARHRALKEAFAHNKAAFPRRSTYKQEQATFFQTPARGDYDSPLHRLTIGTDCSGMEAPLQALANMKIPHDHLFSCDFDPHAQSTIKANFAPHTVYRDLLQRDNTMAPNVDVYIAGFPCQPFSVAGKQQGFEDAKGRGIIFWSIHEYIKLKRPKIFILENVKGIVTLQEGRYLSQILDALHSIGTKSCNMPGSKGATVVSQPVVDPESWHHMSSGKPDAGAYHIYHKILNTREHGVPQNRERWYCVGIRKSCMRIPQEQSFQFPSSIPCPKLEEFLDPNDEFASAKAFHTGQLAASNIAKAHKVIIESGGNPERDTYIVDCDASSSWVQCARHFSPCITRSRHNGHWVTNRKRRFTKPEMFRLQGMDPTRFVVKVSDRSLGQQIGNASHSFY